MYMVEKEKKNRYCTIKEATEVILTNSEVQVIGEIKSIKRFLKESCFDDFDVDLWRKGIIIKGELFCPENKSTIIRITFNNNDILDIPLDLEKEYKLFTDSGELIDELVPLGATIAEIPTKEESIERDDTTL